MTIPVSTKSKQDYGTDPEFARAVEKRFGPIAWDLAAGAENALAPLYFSEEQDSLEQDWSGLHGNLWLNPPYKHILPWARKCRETRLDLDARILLLVPASVGSEWFAEHAWGHATILFLRPRLTFAGEAMPYPKDCMLCAYRGRWFDDAFKLGRASAPDDHVQLWRWK